MAFGNRIELFDAEHGIPRRADEAYLPPVHAFARCMRDAGQVALCLFLGSLAIIFLSLFAYFLGFRFYAWMLVAVCQIIVAGVVLMEASQVLLPYHEFNQLLTYGTAHWASPLYLEGAGFARPSSDYPERGELQLGKLVRPLRRAYRFTIPAASALGSFIFFGAPGMGKSVLLMNYLRMWAYHNSSAIILDPKGELYEYCARFFRRVYRIDFLNPEQTDRWNFLLQCRNNKEYAHMMAAAIIGLEGTKQTAADPFWGEAEIALLTAILMYLPLRVDHPTPPMIHQYIASRTLDQLRADLGGCSDCDVRDQWGTFTKASEITQGSVFTGLAAKLHPFTIDAAKAVTAQILLPEYERGARYIDFAELRQPGVAIFIVIPEGAAARYKMPLGTLFAEAIESLRHGEITDDTTPVLLVVDEAAHIPMNGTKETVGVGRGRRFAMMLFYQNIAQGYDQYGEHGFNSILESINVKTFLPGCGHTTTQYASQLVADTTVWSHTFDDAPGTENDKARSSEASRPLITPAEVRQLLKFKQAITIVETMPPVKWTFPAAAKTGPRLIPRRFGIPRILSIQEAEALTKARRLHHPIEECVSDSPLPPHADSAVEGSSSISRLVPHLQSQIAGASPEASSSALANERQEGISRRGRGASGKSSSASLTDSSFDVRCGDAVHTANEEPDAAERQASRTLSLKVSPEQCIESVVRRRFDEIGRAFVADQQRAEQLLNAHSPDLTSATHTSQQPEGRYASSRQ